MIRRSFLKLLLATPLAGLIKPEKTDKVLEQMNPCPYGMAETTGTSGGEMLLGRVILGDDGSITVPDGESWVVTKLGIDGRIGYIYGYIV
jgi:hypothetical protein